MNRLKIAYISVYDSTDVHNWSGLGYYIAKSVEKYVGDVDYIGNLKTKRFIDYEIKRIIYKVFFKKSFVTDITPKVIKNYAQQIISRIEGKKYDLVFCPGTIPIAMLKIDIPIVFWTDSCQPGLLDFYDPKDNISEESFNHGVNIEKLALNNATLAIYSSDWAASIAKDYHKIDQHKVKVVAFGANIEHKNTKQDIINFIENKSKNICKLLFVGVDWKRKGGDIALNTAQILNEKGLKTELTIVGCEPIIKPPLPDYIKPLGFISKSTEEGKQRINKLFAEAHFLIVPSQAEAYGLVFCEANSFGVPSLATNVGGIPTIIKNDLNGRTFPLDAEIDEYVEYIFNLMNNPNEYKKLALSSFNEFKMRLNWDIAGQTVKKLIDDLLINKT
jgi:glycosyltransferase involved in cell wall biosynthesis